MEIELVSEQEVVKYDHYASREPKQERSVGAVLLLTIEAPDRIGQQKTANWNQDRAD